MLQRDAIVLCTSQQSTGIYYYAGRVALPFSAGAIIEMKQGGYMCFEYKNVREVTEEERIQILKEWNAVPKLDMDALEKLKSEI